MGSDASLALPRDAVGHVTPPRKPLQYRFRVALIAPYAPIYTARTSRSAKGWNRIPPVSGRERAGPDRKFLGPANFWVKNDQRCSTSVRPQKRCQQSAYELGHHLAPYASHRLHRQRLLD